MSGFTHLRLVGGGPDRALQRERSREAAARPCLALKSGMGDKDVIGTNELTALFQSLEAGERIEFVHTLHRDASGNSLEHLPYRLQVRIASTRVRIEALRGRVTGVIASAFPALHFESDIATPVAGLRHITQFVLAGVNVVAKPGLTTGSTSEDSSTRPCWPYPGMLPDRPFRTPLTQPLDLPASTEISIRVHGFSMNAEQCAELHRTLMRLQGGELAAFHPESPITPFSASSGLKDASIPIVRHWLRHPAGWAVDCLVRSSEPLGPVARQLIPAEVFGKHPFAQTRTFESSSAAPLAHPTLAWAIAEGQGIPPLMPAHSVLSTLAVPKHFAAPLATPPKAGAWLGETVCGRRSGPVFLPFETRSRHVGLWGATGAGKSGLLTQMMASDIADPDRRCGVGLIDPHGSLYQRVLELVPRERADDVVLVDTSDLANTACLNPLEGLKDDPLQASFVVSEIMSLIDLLFESKDSSGPLLRNNLRNLLLLTTGVPDRDPCLLDALRILEDTDYAEYVLGKCKDRNVVEYWRKFMRTQGSEHGYAAWGPYMMARLTPFVGSPIMKRLISRPVSTIDLAKAMQEKKIVLFNLNKGVLQDTEVQVLGSLILMKFFSAALGRARISEAERTPFHLYVDEFQNFATDSVPRMFSEARKFGLCLTTANQSLNQLENRWGRSNIAESILANAATKFMFRLGPADIATLEPYFRPQFDAGTMSTLPDFHAVACMSDKNKPLPPFVVKANLARPNPSCHAHPTDLEDLSRQRYTITIDQANEELGKMFALDITTLASRSVEKDSREPRATEQHLEYTKPSTRRPQPADRLSAIWQARPHRADVLNADGGANHSARA